MMADEELGDEVKVFRRDEDADDDPMISGETSEQQLADDKKEAVMEAELDGAGGAGGSGRVPTIGGLKAEAFIKAEPSPSFPMMPMMTGPGLSPAYGLPMMFPFFMRVPIENYMPLMSTGALVCFGVAALIIFILGCLVVYGIRHPDSWPGRAVETAWLWARFVCCLFLCFDTDEADDEAQPVNRVV